MSRRPLLAGSLAAALLAGGFVGGLALAQPTPPIEVVPPPGPATPTEEAPPINIVTPAPIKAPPLKDEEVAPAAAPKAQVAEKPVEVPIRRARYDLAVIQALDKVTAETLRFQAAVGQPVRWKGLVFTVRACERSAPNEAVDDSVAYLSIQSQPRPQPGRPTPPPREAFKGWMYASSPGLHPLEHATYDAWVISCRASRPAVAAVASAPVAKVASAPVAKAASAPAATPSPRAAPTPAVASPKAAPTPAPKAPPPATPAAPAPEEPIT